MTPRNFTATALALALLVTPLPARATSITLVAVGDVGMNLSSKKVYADGVKMWGKKRVPFKKLFQNKKIRKFINGQIRFLNLETVITRRNDIAPETKKYNFRTHPNALKAMFAARWNFNLFSIANNHMRDYGKEGIADTRKWLTYYKKRRKRGLWFAGAGKDITQASRATMMTVRGGVKVAFAAVSIGPVATDKRAGVAPTYRAHALKNLKKKRAHIRILSMHAGNERALKPVGYQRSLAHRAIDKYKVDIVIGHHPHVVQGIERYNGGIILYSLGNFALRGARDMGKVKELRGKGDYGLAVKLVMDYSKRRGRLRFKILQALPVYDMHSGPHPFKKPEQSCARIKVLNKLSARLARKKNPRVVLTCNKAGEGLHYFKKK